MKKVLVYRLELLPYSETFIKQQILALRDWRAILVGEKRLPNGLDLSAIPVRTACNSNHDIWKSFATKLARVIERPAPGMVRQLSREHAQLLHIHFGVDAVKFWPTASRLGLPVIVTLHGYDINVAPQWWEAGHGGLAMRHYPERLRHLARHPLVRFIAVSEEIRLRAVEFGLPPEKLSVRYIGVDIDAFRPGSVPVGERERRILFVGRLIEKKGCGYLIEAFAQVRQSLPDAHLVVIGDGPLRQDYEHLAAKLNVPVDFRGALPPAQVQAEMAQARLFCLPSVVAENGDAEGLPISILEAQACGLPVVTSARGGATEGILPGESGFAHRPGDIHALAQHLSALLRDSELAQHFSRAARVHGEQRFDIRRCSAALETSYDDALTEFQTLQESKAI